jgi:YjbE family integral membrane protein
MTVGVVWLLKIPGLMLLGGLGLVWVAYRLLVPHGAGGDRHQPAASTFWGAMKTIVIADALMGIDNVLGVAGAAKGSFDLVIIGLLISVPIVVWGSTLVLKLVERFPGITYLGAGVLAYTAAHMVVSEPLLDAVFDTSMLNRVLAHTVLIVGVLGAGWWTTGRLRQRTPASH